MLDLTSAKTGRLLSVTETDIEQRKAIAGRGDDDIPRITSLKSMIEQRVDHCAEVFFNHRRQDPAPNSLLGAAPSTARRGVGLGASAGDRGGASRHDRIPTEGTTSIAAARRAEVP